MLVKKKDSKKVVDSKEFKIWVYPTTSKLTTISTAIINGRHPLKGRTGHTKFEEIYYVLSGTGIVHSEKGDFKISEGDTYLIEKEEKYYVEGKKLHLVLINVPPWCPE